MIVNIRKIAAGLLLTTASARAQLVTNYVTGCVADGEFEPTIDYFPEKYEPPTIFTYHQETDIYGERFVPHNTTDLLDITYFGNYKIIYNKHQNVSYLLYQCGTVPPQDEIDSGKHHLVLAVPHRGGVAITETPQIPPMELLGLREEIIGYIGDPQYVSSPCLVHMMSEENGAVEVVWNEQDPYNFTNNELLRAQFLERHPEVIIFGGPLDEAPFPQRTINVAATQERTNVATFDWIALFAALYNLEAMSNKISRETQARYDCTSTNARIIVDQRGRRRRRRQLQQAEPTALPTNPGEIKILWANYFDGYNWSVAECPTWDAAFYCEYATHCGTSIISRPPDMGYSQNYGGPTDYWYINNEELLQIGKDADIWIFPGSTWDEVYAQFNATLDQFRAVQNKQVYDNQGSGSGAWFEQRYAEYDVVGLDMCDLVGTNNPNGPSHQRRWFRNVYTEPVGSLPACNVPDELTEPYVPRGADCELLTEADFAENTTSTGESTEAATKSPAAAASSAIVASNQVAGLISIIVAMFMLA